MSRPETEVLTSVGDLLRYAATRFGDADLAFGHGTDNPWDEAVSLIASSLKLPLDRLHLLLETRLLDSERSRLLERITRRVDERLPLPYITGEAAYADLLFEVSPDVIVPRSPIFELLNEQRFPEAPARILDLCCGSGALGIVAAGAFPDALVDLVDVSEPALAIARRNIERFGLGERVRCVSSDLWSAVEGEWDLIISNPPYVTDSEMDALPAEYRHEPTLALHAEDAGLAIAERILRGATGHLAERGTLILEVGDAAAELLLRYPALPFEWPEFQNGGHGVCVLPASALLSVSA